jgi:hypothetical protein
MGRRITKFEFLEVVHDEVPKHFAETGFLLKRPAAYWRNVGAVEQGMFLYPDSDFTRIHVPTGAQVPELDRRFETIRGGRYGSLLVSRWLGEFKQPIKRTDSYYYYRNLEDLRSVIARVHHDFVEQAEPWLAQLVTIDDVAREFHAFRIASKPGEERPPDPFGWAMYGWLLQAAGRELEAKPWLKMALEQFNKPAFYAKGIQIVPIGTRGAKPLPRTPEELRTIELLKIDLGVE